MSQRILVTGADGFIGSALLPALSAAGYEVARFDLAEGDISRDPLPCTGIARVIHLAARTYVPDSWNDPFAFYQANVMGAANVLEFCRRQGCGVTLLSSYLYGPPARIPIPETAPLAPNSPYNHSKLLAESLGQFYAEKFDLPVTILRPFNIYGPGQRGDFLIPSLIRQALDPACAAIEVADLEPRRDYLYLDDLLRAIQATLASPPALAVTPAGAVYNLGSGQSYSVAEVIQAVQAAAGSAKPVRSRMQRRPGEVMDSVADITRARAGLGWQPLVPFAEGIRRSVAAAQAGAPTP